MTIKIFALLLLCLQFENSEQAKFKTRIASTELGSATIGTIFDLSTTAEIEYDAFVQTGIPNTVTVKTSPIVTGAAIYIDITNLCELTEYSFCEQKGYSLIEDIRVLLTEKDGGIYEGTYTIESEVEGEFSMTFFIVGSDANGFFYENNNYEKGISAPAYRLTSFGDSPSFGCNDCTIVRWHGKWTLPESRVYELDLSAFSKNGAAVYCYISLDGVTELTHNINSATTTHADPKLYMEAKEYDFIFECQGMISQLSYTFFWKHPADSVWGTASGFRRIVPTPVTKVVRVTYSCARETFFNKGLGRCVKCPRGTCQPDIGQDTCIPCKP